MMTNHPICEVLHVQPIQIRTFGEFSIQIGDAVISDTGNRSRKVWALIAYLILHRKQVVSQQKLIDLLWGSDSSANPENALRITIHRARTFLDSLEDGAGRALIQQKDGGYVWNGDAECILDCDRFDALCQSVANPETVRLSDVLEALSLYRGEFLPKQSAEVWVIPISTHFHNQFLVITEIAASLLVKEERYQEAAEICRKAIAAEPYHEPLHRTLMQLLAAMKKPKEAAEVYETLCKRLFDDFGIRPNEETRAVYRAAAHALEDRSIPIDEVIENLQEPIALPGALQCDYDYFKVLCYAESRAIERSGNATHVALLSLSVSEDKALTKRSINRIMDQLGEQLRLNLRRGDTISRCSLTQYIIMLPKANYENSCMVCKRVLGAFRRAHPHITANINYMVQPLTPSICIP